jgi:hypothetical protein
VIQYCYLSCIPWFNDVNVLWVVTVLRWVMFSDIPHRHLISCPLRPDIFSEAPSNCVLSLRVTDLLSQRHVFGWIHLISFGKVGKVHPCTDTEALYRGRGRGIALTYHDHGTRRGWGVSVTPQLLFTPGKDPAPIVQEAGLAAGTVWTSAENLAPTGIRSPDRPARSQSLYRLR